MNKSILVTGGTGYIGSHTCVQLLENGYNVIIVDNLSNSNIDVISKIQTITNKQVKFYKADIRDEKALQNIFKENQVDCVIHFAGLKAVGESVKMPLSYYDNNVNGTLVLLKVMIENNCKNIIFSSSATVYGEPERLPIDENCRLHTTNPYGTTKLMIENILKDVYTADNSWKIVLLRYFNPVGAHKSGLIGENPVGIPNNLTPYIAKVATGELPFLQIFGNDYDTLDGTGVRDYIHVEDLANGHLKAIENVQTNGVHVYNLGTGKGYSVLEVLHAFEKACGHTLQYKIMPRRNGDIASCYADCSKANKELNWKAKYNIDDMCASLWYFQQNNK